VASEGLAVAEGVECPALYSRGRGAGVLFLHGYSFDRRIWSSLGFTRLVEGLGHPLAAPDMPYGRRTGCTRRTRSVEVNTAIALDALERLARARPPAAVVGASLGGRYAVYLAAAGAAGALVLAAPALGGDERAWSLLRGLRGRLRCACVIWGDRDRVVGEDEAREAARLLGADLTVVEGAGHVVYRDSPDTLAAAVRRALSALAPPGGPEGGHGG